MPKSTVMVIIPKPLPPDVEADRTLVRKLLGLRSDRHEFKIIYGALSGNDNEVAVQTLSAFQILNILGSNVEVPPDHIADGRTYPPTTESADMTQSMPRLIRIHAEKSQPADAFAAVKYSDYWYWIDNRDFKSKGIFTFLMIMMTLAEKGDNVQAPVVTIQGN